MAPIAGCRRQNLRRVSKSLSPKPAEYPPQKAISRSLRDNIINDIIRGVKPNTPFNNSHARFLTTRWSIVLSCSDSATDEQKANAALAELCKIYWRPVFAFICRKGHSVPDAQDLTQEFFGKVIKG